jgi:outer membrane protein assembly factor BamB
MDVATSPSSKADEILVIVSGSYNNTNTSRLLVIEGIRVASSKELWKTNWTGSVQYINCHLININNDKINDCILHSTERGLIAVDSGTGLLLWQLHSHHETSPDTRAMNVTKLRSVSDVDGDTTPDLLAVVTNITQSLLMIISGRNGQLLWQQTLEPNCSQKLIHLLNTAIDPPCLNQSGEFSSRVPRYLLKF